MSFRSASVVATLSPIPLGSWLLRGTCTGLLHLMGGAPPGADHAAVPSRNVPRHAGRVPAGHGNESQRVFYRGAKKAEVAGQETGNTRSSARVVERRERVLAGGWDNARAPGIASRPKRNGSTPAGRAPQPPGRSATTTRRPTITDGFCRTPRSRRIPRAARSRTRGGSLTCTGTSGSGARTCTIETTTAFGQDNPVGPSGIGPHVFRGGSWKDWLLKPSSAFRNWGPPMQRPITGASALSGC